MSSETLHEEKSALSSETLDMHRAIASLMEELEAVDWYGQRIEATQDAELRRVLAHNRDEEKEHACMVLEWIRRRDPDFDTYLERFLFREGSIVEGDSHDDGGGPGRPDGRSGGALPLRLEEGDGGSDAGRNA